MSYYVGNAVDNAEDYTGALSSVNVNFRYAMLSNAIVIAFTAGYIPSASYAYAHHDYYRWINLGAQVLWLNFFDFGDFHPSWSIFSRNLCELFFYRSSFFEICYSYAKIWFLWFIFEFSKN